MPTLKKDIKTKRIVLPKSSESGEEAWVDVETEFTVGHLRGIDLEAPRMEVAVQLVAKIVKDWNFTEADGTKSPITEESIGFLPLDDINAIFEQAALDNKVATLSREKKSQSSST